MNLTCKHCQKQKVNRPRGLCWSCYYTPGVKAMYESLSKFGRRGVADTYGGHVLPEPTDAKPGTPEKAAVLEQRAEKRQRLWHPDDATH